MMIAHEQNVKKTLYSQFQEFQRTNRGPFIIQKDARLEKIKIEEKQKQRAQLELLDRNSTKQLYETPNGKKKVQCEQKVLKQEFKQISFSNVSDQFNRQLPQSPTAISQQKQLQMRQFIVEQENRMLQLKLEHVQQFPPVLMHAQSQPVNQQGQRQLMMSYPQFPNQPQDSYLQEPQSPIFVKGLATTPQVNKMKSILEDIGDDFQL